MTDVRALIDDHARAVEQDVISWRHTLHEHPELPNREEKTAAMVARHLTGLGFDTVRTGVAGHGVIGVLHGGDGDRVMGLRADMDALPVKELQDVPFRSTVVDEDYPDGPFPVAHMCGHDVHTAVLMGAASVLAGLREHLPGTVKMIFQPAEEGPPITEDGGADLMVRDGALENPRPDMMFVLHTSPFPAGMLNYSAGHALASSDYLSIRVEGQGVHGSTPWMGKDPMPVAAEIITALGQVYRQVPANDAMTISIGKVVDSGRFNVIGDGVELIGTIRVLQDEILDDVHARVDRIASHVAAAHGLTATTTFRQHVPSVHNDPAWLDRILPTARRVMGDKHVQPSPPTLGYDDASLFVNPVGGAYMLLGGQDTEVADGRLQPVDGGRGLWPNHNPHFYFDDGVLVDGVRLHSHVTYDFLTGAI
ncbi:M20 family metallopeptidase [Isoptericola sp. b408]|uniref:M20 metallopeptidase family protein n=1 Tax=Isoptericola sp. b408 TaxID=3064653 RepID=UPI00271375A5|nr:amidohydrolase [Isoptericola sp. b408]MDO8150531.1 amidohydrolase [Isoptericola sp. b408]